jgi:hypothetical protein
MVIVARDFESEINSATGVESIREQEYIFGTAKR